MMPVLGTRRVASGPDPVPDRSGPATTTGPSGRPPSSASLESKSTYASDPIPPAESAYQVSSGDLPPTDACLARLPAPPGPEPRESELADASLEQTTSGPPIRPHPGGDQAPPHPATMTPRQRARRDRLIEAALALLEEDDYEQVQVKDVADRAGVSLGTLYNYFSSKERLFAEVLVRWADSLPTNVRSRPLEQARPADRLMEVVHRALRAFERRPQMARPGERDHHVDRSTRDRPHGPYEPGHHGRLHAGARHHGSGAGPADGRRGQRSLRRGRTRVVTGTDLNR